MNIACSLSCSLALALASTTALADAPAVYGFEGLTVPFYSAGFIPDGYADATWTGWILRRRDELQYTGLNGGSGAILALGMVSAPEIHFDAPVVFDGLLAFYPHAQLSYDLYLGTQHMATSVPGPVGGGYLASGYAGAVDRIVFNGPAGGFSIDDMAVIAAAPVPEPAGWALMLAGTAALGLFRLRRQQR